ncbi:Glutathione synthetase [Dirofilaria immitis]
MFMCYECRNMLTVGSYITEVPQIFGKQVVIQKVIDELELVFVHLFYEEVVLFRKLFLFVDILHLLIEKDSVWWYLLITEDEKMFRCLQSLLMTKTPPSSLKTMMMSEHTILLHLARGKSGFSAKKP